jgi:hypothetical protein
MREYCAIVMVVLMLVEGSHAYTLVLAGKVRKKQTLRDSSFDTEPPRLFRYRRSR